MKQITELASWLALEKHAQSLRLSPFNALKKEFVNQSVKLSAAGIKLDFSHQKIDNQALMLLINLANELKLKDKIEALFQGKKVNLSENRPALHTALRSKKASLFIDEKDVMVEIASTREKIRFISDELRSGKWLGYTGHAIKDVVNIGIGGSDLGPRFCINALAPYQTKELNFHFISDADPHAFTDVCHNLCPETTLFIISSKSFTTKETLYNAKKALVWLNAPQHIDKHFIAVTAAEKKAREFGFSNILPIWDWVGGRYSLTSAINLITAIAIGYDAFSSLLEGANEMDEHFLNADLDKNLAVMMALVGLWNINFLHITNHLLLVYSKRLEQFVPYIQQLDMESNGKSVDNNGQNVNYATGPIIWGGLGNQAQHSYYQLLCQGTHKVAIDFISTNEFNDTLLNSFCDAKIDVLTKGIDFNEEPHSYIAGGVPLNHLSFESCTPKLLGALIALYEHKIYVQSVLWNINAFDQPGVESAKRIRPSFVEKAKDINLS